MKNALPTLKKLLPGSGLTLCQRILLIAAIITTMVLGQVAVLAAQPARVAVIADDPALAMAVDFLTVDLSKQPDVRLLERAEIDRVVKELALSAATAKNYLKLGQVLGADGLLTLELAKEGSNTWLNLRLIAVKPGVALASQKYPWPLQEIETWVPIAANQLKTLLPKLNVLPKDAVPISILNLRSATQSKEGQDLERELTLLMIRRLIHEKPLFVLERQKLEAASQEKALNADETTFWNGSYLLDGTINKEGISTDKVTVSLRLTPPAGAAPVVIEVAGSRTNLRTIIEDVTTKVLEALKQKSTASDWKPEDEAKQYLDEAKWALKWGMLNEAQAASDTTWALGLKTRDSAETRVRIYMAESIPNLGEWTIDEDFRTLTERPFDPVTAIWAIRASSFYNEYSRLISNQDSNPDKSWFWLGIDMLEAVSRFFYLSFKLPGAKAQIADRLPELRQELWATVAYLEGVPDYHDVYWRNGRLDPQEKVDPREGRVGRLFHVIFENAANWTATPEETIKVYRKLMTGEGFSYFRQKLLTGSIPLAALLENRPSQLLQLRSEFIKDLIASTNPVTKIEGLIFFLDNFDPQGEKLDVQVTEAVNRLMKEIETNRQLIIEYPAGLEYWNDVAKAFNHSLLRIPDALRAEREDWFQSSQKPLLDNLARARSEKLGQLRASSAKSAKFMEQLALLSEANLTNWSQRARFEFVNSVVTTSYEKSEAQDLRVLVTNFQAKLYAELSTAVEPARAQLFMLGLDFDRVEGHLNRILGLPPPRGVMSVKYRRDGPPPTRPPGQP